MEVAFEEIPQRELRVALCPNTHQQQRLQVAFEEIPQRELREVSYRLTTRLPRQSCCIRRNPTKGIESSASLCLMLLLGLCCCIRRNPTKGIESCVGSPLCRLVWTVYRCIRRNPTKGIERRHHIETASNCLCKTLHSKKSHKGNWEDGGWAVSPEPPPWVAFEEIPQRELRVPFLFPPIYAHGPKSVLHSKKSHKGNWE